MRRVWIGLSIAAALVGVSAGSAGAATLAPSSASFGDTAIGTVSPQKSFTVTAEAVDTALPLTVSTTGDFRQTNDCPSTLGFLLTSSCTIRVSFAPTTSGPRTGTLSTTTLVVGGPSAALSGNGVGSVASAAQSKKCKKKAKKKGKKHARAAKKKKAKKCGKKKRRKHRR
jgi:hypothetical protein